MKKPKPSLRRPPTPSPGEVDQFVSSGTSRRQNVQTSQKSERRRTTIYFSPETAKRLKLAAVERDEEISTLADRAVTKWLDENG